MDIERKLLNIYSKLLEIYKKLILDYRNYKPKFYEKRKIYAEINNLYLEYLKLTKELGTNSPHYIESLDGFKYGNCYTYALGIKCPEIFYDILKLFNLELRFNVGFIANSKQSINSEESLLDNFYQDCEALNIKVYDSDIASKVSHGGFKIFMFKDWQIKRSHDFHFVRENSDGTLSHRTGYNQTIEKIEDIYQVDPDYTYIRALEIVKPRMR